jgi:hypothetical protein
MMFALKKLLMQTPGKDRSAADKKFLEAYGKTIDYSDKESIKPLLDFVNTPRAK